MAQTHAKLANPIKPAAGTETTFYTVPAVTKCQVYHMLIANTGSTPCLVRVYFVASGGSVGTLANAIYYDIQIPGRDTFVANIASLLETGDIIRVTSDNGNATFHFSGMLIT